MFDAFQEVGLFGTPVRSKTLLLISMLGETHASEVSRILKISLSQAQRAILSYERMGVVSVVTKGTLRRVSLNARYPYYAELSALLTKIARDSTPLRDELMQMRRRPRRTGKQI